MLQAAVLFFVLALVAMVFGAYGVAGISMDLGHSLLVVFLILATISFVAGMVAGRNNNVIQ